MNRFTIIRDHWYACEIIGDEFSDDRCSYSPIKVLEFKAMNGGTQQFTLEFFHGNYPAGVQNKVYTLKTIERGESFILAHALNCQPTRLLQIYDIDGKWLKRHFGIDSRTESNCELELWLDENIF